MTAAWTKVRPLILLLSEGVVNQTVGATGTEVILYVTENCFGLLSSFGSKMETMQDKLPGLAGASTDTESVEVAVALVLPERGET